MQGAALTVTTKAGLSSHPWPTGAMPVAAAGGLVDQQPMAAAVACLCPGQGQHQLIPILSPDYCRILQHQPQQLPYSQLLVTPSTPVIRIDNVAFKIFVYIITMLDCHRAHLSKWRRDVRRK